MKFFLPFLFILAACAHTSKMESSGPTGDFTDRSGWVSVFQTATSKNETTINILRPHLTEMKYVVEGLGEQKIIKTIGSSPIHWKIDRIHIKGLKPGQAYKLLVQQKRSGKTIDWREFSSLNLDKKKAQFIVGSCMSDSHAFEHVRGRIWQQMMDQQADFMVLLGDQVYVDDFDFVKRGKATEFDIWTRYIDSFRKIPLFQMRKLIPIYAIWDDHDFGTNNSDRTFPGKKAAEKVFRGFFGSENIPGIYGASPKGVFAYFNGFGQKFIFMDDRYFRNPASQDPYGQWGELQHKWFLKAAQSSQVPIWLANGNQFFADGTFVEQKNGKKKKINESIKSDHPKHYEKIMDDIKKLKVPVAFLAGDVHYSEISKLPKDILGYETYEITSSPIHSYIFRTAPGEQEFLNNKYRWVAAKDHNFMLVASEVVDGGLKVSAKAYGIKQSQPIIDKTFEIQKAP
ncbi:MAG: alkaline phosphatase family protein [Bdellovibrionales bacterium]|nr:alkaline phosphatase family protein [Bdellovibrionales bacterium]